MQNIKPDITATNIVTRHFRIIRIACHTLLGVILATIALPLANKQHKAKLIQWWCKHLLAAFNLRVISYGNVPEPNTQLNNAMFVANHISWTDIHALNSIVAIRFIAKSEIRNWPIFGYLVSRANTLFIDRSKKKDAKRTIDIALKSLQDGDTLCLFPEGTTTDGTLMQPFKSSLLQAAIEAQSTIWPVAIHYPHPNGGANVDAAYAGETTLVESMQKILSQKQPVNELHFLTPITADHTARQDRRTLTLHVESLIRSKLSL